EDPPDARGPLPFRLRAEDFEPLMEQRRVEDQGLVLAAFAARMDASTSFQAQQIVDGLFVPASTQPRRIEALGRDARESDLESGDEVVAEETVGIVLPQRREDSQAQLFRDPFHPVVLVIRRYRAMHDAVRFDATEDPAHFVELALFTGLGRLSMELMVL